MVSESSENFSHSKRRLVAMIGLVAASCLSFGCASQAPTIAHVHIGHAITGHASTPENAGFFQLAEEQASAVVASLQRSLVVDVPGIEAGGRRYGVGARSRLQGGEPLTLDVVLQNRGAGHRFPGPQLRWCRVPQQSCRLFPPRTGWQVLGRDPESLRQRLEAWLSVRLPEGSSPRIPELSSPSGSTSVPGNASFPERP